MSLGISHDPLESHDVLLRSVTPAHQLFRVSECAFNLRLAQVHGLLVMRADVCRADVQDLLSAQRTDRLLLDTSGSSGLLSVPRVSQTGDVIPTTATQHVGPTRPHGRSHVRATAQTIKRLILSIRRSRPRARHREPD